MREQELIYDVDVVVVVERPDGLERVHGESTSDISAAILARKGSCTVGLKSHADCMSLITMMYSTRPFPTTDHD